MRNSDTMDLSTKQVFTTGEAADLCRISQQTIIRCFDSGRLRGFRVPGSRFRRIPRDELLRFMRDNSIPTGVLECGRRRVLIVDTDRPTVGIVTETLTREERFDVRSAATGYEAGLQTLQFKPDLMLLECDLPDVDSRQVCHSVRANPDLSGMQILLMSASAPRAQVDVLLKSGANDFLPKPVDPAVLMDRVGTLLWD